MKLKKLILFIFLVAAVAVYFVFFQKDKTLKFVPENTDAVVLIDVKNLSRQYIYSLANHPSQWFEDKKKDKESIFFKNSGLKIPDFVQIFHLENTKFSNWYSVLQIKDNQKFLAFIKSKKFSNIGESSFKKDGIFIKIEGEYCIFGTSDVAFKEISTQLFQVNKKSYFNADQFIDSGIGSVSFISGKNITNFSIELKDDEIEIKNTSNTEIFASIFSKIKKSEEFLEIELDAKNIKNAAAFFNKNIGDSAQINYLKASANLEQVNDTIITYDYDDDFNEIEKIAVQKIVQPNYAIALKSKSLEKTWEYFKSKKWINAQKQFTAIPFQPNSIVKNLDEIKIESTKNHIKSAQNINENYIFIKNDPLLLSSFSTFTKNEKKIVSIIDYIFYSNKEQDYYLRLKVKKETLPLILR